MNESLTLVLDTNVLLGDPDALFAYPNATLILPLTVLDEMDQFKKEYNERGRNARVLALYLDQLRVQGSLTQGVPVGNGATLLVDLEEGLKAHPGMDLKKGSNRVLMATVAIRERLKKKVVLVTNDLNLRVRASALGIPVQSHDERGQKGAELYQGMARLEPNAEQTRQLEKLGYIEDEKLKYYPNQNLVIGLGGRDQLFRFHSPKGKLKRVRPLEKGVSGLFPKNLEQLAALDLLLDEEVHIVTLAGLGVVVPREELPKNPGLSAHLPHGPGHGLSARRRGGKTGPLDAADPGQPGIPRFRPILRRAKVSGPRRVDGKGSDRTGTFDLHPGAQHQQPDHDR